ncbi:amidohydrolase [uncultured Oscillibacter sp.]|uniref:amidohydrolase n=1 Tax=uncultured Oscillibacter sp. TaxID=876091 RepID=UPI002605F2E8|nr:amidohydrolase [uncultured Oscillibacter sp.]
MKLLLKHCGILATEGTGFRCLENAYLGVDGDTIDYIGTEKPQGPYDREKDMAGRLLLPGLINCHGHSPMVLLRGVGSDLSLQEWLFGKIMPIEDKLTAEDIKIGNQLALLEMLSTGTTSYSDMYFEPQTAVENALACGIKANISRPVQCFNKDETYAENFRAKESIQLFKNHHGAGDGRVRIDFSVHAEYTCFEHIVGPYSADCKSLGGRMHIHLSETKKEHDECVEKYGKTPAKWFYDLGTFDCPTAAAHCVWVTEEDMALMLEKGVSPVHNPTSNMKLGSGFAPVQRMLDLGLNVTLGTDGAASNNNLNMLEELHLASVLHNGFHRDPTILKPAQLLAMATRNGAQLQGREDTGELAVGKKADIIALDLTRPHMVPNFDPLALTVYSAQGGDVVMTMVDGKILYENGEFLTLDADKILHEADAAARRLHG